jgi:hypothetical protein
MATDRSLKTPRSQGEIVGAAIMIFALTAFEVEPLFHDSSAHPPFHDILLLGCWEGHTDDRQN